MRYSARVRSASPPKPEGRQHVATGVSPWLAEKRNPAPAGGGRYEGRFKDWPADKLLIDIRGKLERIGSILSSDLLPR